MIHTTSRKRGRHTHNPRRITLLQLRSSVRGRRGRHGELRGVDGDTADGDGVVCKVAIKPAGVEIYREGPAGMIVEGGAFAGFVG